MRSRSTITDVETFKDDIYGLRNRSNRQTIVTVSRSIFTACALYQSCELGFVPAGSMKFYVSVHVYRQKETSIFLKQHKSPS